VFEVLRLVVVVPAVLATLHALGTAITTGAWLVATAYVLVSLLWLAALSQKANKSLLISNS
jgi:hypothetical protein